MAGRGEKTGQVTANGEQHVLMAPEQLGLETRAAFRRAAVELMEGMGEGGGRLVIDLSATRSVDSAGLSTVIMVQRRAAGQRVRVRLRGMSEELRFLFVLTKLEDLFEIEDAADT